MDNSQGKPLWLITRAALWLMTGLGAIATAILLWIIVRLSLGDGFGPDMDAIAAPGLLPRLYLLGAMGLAALLMVGLILRKLLAMLTSLTAGHAFHAANAAHLRSEEHTSELQSLMRISYAVFCLKKKNNKTIHHRHTTTIQ